MSYIKNPLRIFILSSLLLCTLLTTLCFAGKGKSDPLIYDDHAFYFERLDVKSVKPITYEGNCEIFFTIQKFNRTLISYIPVSTYVGSESFIYDYKTGQYKHYRRKYAKIDPITDTSTRDNDSWFSSSTADRAINYLKQNESELLTKIYKQVDTKDAELAIKRAEKAKQAKQIKVNYSNAIGKYEEIYNDIMSGYLENNSDINNSVTDSNPYFFQTDDTYYTHFPEDRTPESNGENVQHLHWVGNPIESMYNDQYDFTISYVNDEQTMAYSPIYDIRFEEVSPDFKEEDVPNKTDAEVTSYWDMIVEIPLDSANNKKAVHHGWSYNVTPDGDIHYSISGGKEGNFSDYEKDNNNETAKIAIVMFYREVRPFTLMKPIEFHKNEFVQEHQDTGIKIAKEQEIYNP